MANVNELNHSLRLDTGFFGFEGVQKVSFINSETSFDQGRFSRLCNSFNVKPMLSARYKDNFIEILG